MADHREQAVEDYLEDSIGFEKLKEVVGEEDAETVKAAEKQVQNGEELAKQLSENPVKD